MGFQSIGANYDDITIKPNIAGQLAVFNYDAIIKLACISVLDNIRQLISGSTTYSKGFLDLFSEAYIDADGRNNSVVTSIASTGIAIFNTNKYVSAFANESAAGTLSDTDSFTNPTYAFDTSLSTEATKSGVTATYSLGKTFATKTISRVYIKTLLEHSHSGTYTKQTLLQAYNGATWSTIATLTTGTGSSYSYDGYVTVNASHQGLRIQFTQTGGSLTCHLYSLWYGNSTNAVTSTITHTIPTGTLSPTINKVIGVPMFADWETGADIKYKLTNATEDTGWLDCSNEPKFNEFTAFTSEPTSLIVQLIPKSTIPTAGFPAIYGFGILEV